MGSDTNRQNGQGPQLQEVSVDEALPLRQHALRPGQDIERCRFPNDFEPHTVHLGIRADDRLIAVGTLLREGSDGKTDGLGWRIRGMAVQSEHRGHGLGSKILQGLLAHAQQAGGDHVWCNARTSAEEFYQRHGMSPRGEVFDIPEIGPHVVYEIRF